MPTDEEILDILLQIRAQGLAEADAVNAIVGKTGNTAAAVAGQVGGLTVASERAAGSFKSYETNLKNAVIVSGEAGSITDGLARKMNALGQLGISPTSAALVGGVVALGGLVMAGKSATQIAEENEKADKSLAQAYAQLGEAVPTNAINAFINTNRGAISSIATTKEGFATLARAGMDSQMQFRLMNDALDLSKAKSIDLNTAINTLLMAESGRATGLLQLGINVREVVDPQKDLTKAEAEYTKARAEAELATRKINEEEQRLHDKRKVTANDLMTLNDIEAKGTIAQDKYNQAMKDLAAAQALVNDKGDKFKSILDQLEPKIAGARNNTTTLEQDMNKLNTDWQQLAADGGPGLVTVLDTIVTTVDDWYQGLKKIGEDDKLWGDISKHVTDLANDVNRTARGFGVGPPNAPPGTPQSGSKVQWDPTTRTWTWAVGPNGTITQHAPGEYVDPATGAIYSVSNPQEQSGPQAPRPQDFGLNVDDQGRIIRNPRGGNDAQMAAYNLAMQQYQVAVDARKEAKAAYDQQLAQLQQINANTKQPTTLNITIPGTVAGTQAANVYSRQIRRMTTS